ncbi:MAG: hypothetical protein SF052_10685 [Bacteroidia bacterium]|nr:hypothetical protein [Bacteroidia bacterium]
MYQKVKISQQVEAKLSQREIPREDLFILKFSVSLYLPTPDTDIQPIRSTITHEDKIYEVVKQRIAQDTLYLYCAQNRLQERLIDDLKQYIVRFFTESTDTPESRQFAMKFDVKDYVPGKGYVSTFCPVILRESFTNRYIESCFAFFYGDIEAPPPESTLFSPTKS